MSNGAIPSEVELAFELMPCNALRLAQEPLDRTPHPCSYFRKWGTHHSYDYETAGPPPDKKIVQLTQYEGRAPLVPEMLSGCRKAPIMAVGINPNLPGWWAATRNSINPLFDDFRQYAHYFRYRETAKLEIPPNDYKKFGGGPQDAPLSNFELAVPSDTKGFRTIPVELQPVAMYLNYQSLLDDLAKTMGWTGHELSVGEDVSYGNMVACPSAKWITKPDPNDPTMPPMTPAEQAGIVRECFHHRRYFLRQLFQSLPVVLMIFSQSTTDAFLGEMQGRFSEGDVKVGDKIDDLMDKTVRLRFGTDGAGGKGWWHDAMNIDLSRKTRGAGIKVGVIDTGCGPHANLAHVTLVGAFIDGKVLPPAQGLDVAEHGTHTSGIIGARPSKAGDYAGMAPGSELFHARVFKGEEPGQGPTQADIINAIDSLSRDHQCDLINMSLGGGPRSDAEEDAIRDAAERGTLCICSAGNDNGPIEFPGAYPECAAVSAIGQIGWAPAGTFSADNRPRDASKMGQDNLFLAAFSCFGPTLACAAPGVGIISTVPERNGLKAPYMEMDGTSMASPAACGALAVILAGDAQYQATSRDISRTKLASLLLAKHCVPFGMSVKFEGRGLPKV